MTTNLIWFRNDLRVTDNPALTNACKDQNATVIALYIATPEQWKMHHMSARQAYFIHVRLTELQKELAELNIQLLYQSCNNFTDSIDVIDNICQEYQINQLFYNRQYEFNEHKRDCLLKKKLKNSVKCIELDGNLFTIPLTIRNGKGEMYKVFTPFRNTFLDQFIQTDYHLYEQPEPRENQKIKSKKIPAFDYPTEKFEFFSPITKKALQRLEEFCAEKVEGYTEKRDIPSLDYTSQLSAYLALGVLSVRQCLHYLTQEYPRFWENQKSGAFSWFNELIWREFYQHLMVAHPRLCKHKPFIEWTDNIQWKNNKDHFEQWKAGNTGYPIIDAAMRQLNQTGWMHNRLRMITASFLVKDLLIDWRWGEQYFMSQLTDGDLAANNGGWQWAASTGTDSTPYFRIFNPTTQGQRFDPEGIFIKQWLPELKQVPTKLIHTPHQWAEKVGKPLNYPNPIIIHDIARKVTLEAFEKAKKTD
ncbi:deoxyribodipyrimidine photo-lyase [Commensalibacter papalotli (ex Botero et al. 2024)]|uniref:Deoxyribodipyrimidine photolyase (PhrB) (PDB:1TEZ) n=1 Tax=Commensalibacter papalotli (ex Botero et al. 2024) TaxID=2972766 RepID=A0ABM9HT15_9PROT|nr:deoxyribodipyrimidine photo-lyase [Commensalibacter papalotli (ex Botero et al. 2024)]CAI3952572.1 Deoxyribodipyrimidine photolyase (PhrB) (PDB:1TEZ) [Commensalibacter papalotli (ex Botero et al. 2024)]CAI3957372.1 Deoxyribodipyrimidine photolyase (PhrB) (PDB:1TEZ) [Commensalibacter papalotli (ex Botero et al. 2024)]